MTKVLIFKIEIEGLENKIWRKIEITDRRTVAELAYTILASFDSLAYHLYKIVHGDNVYDSMVDFLYEDEDHDYIDATKTKLKDISFNNNKMIMDYDFGSTTTFIITYLGNRDFEKGNGMHYPYILEGSGHGMLEDISGDELKEVVEDIDKKGYSEYSFTPGYRGNKIYDYRNFEVRKNNIHVRRYFSKIKYSYEIGD